MDIEQWPTDRPKPYQNNPRKNNIKACGFRSPIVDTDGLIIAALVAAAPLDLPERAAA